jgi:hypothetical protein
MRIVYLNPVSDGPWKEHAAEAHTFVANFKLVSVSLR